jgi:chemotaxis protein methyltransferase CheR
MVLTLTNEEFNLLRELIQNECGIQLQDGKQYLVESRLANIVYENSCSSFTEFYQLAKSSLNKQLREKIVDAMTTNETLWFRDEAPYITLRDKIFPEIFRQLLEGRQENFRIWSAACSTGQEPYSIAMMIHEALRLNRIPVAFSEKFEIIATDISNSALTIAKNGRYNSLAMSRGMLPELQERYFVQQSSVWQLNEEIKKMIHFQQFNLQSSFHTLGVFDIVFLRNVAIYFSDSFKVQLFQKIVKALKPEGLLFLGASESLLGYSDDFETREHGRCNYYQLKRR